MPGEHHIFGLLATHWHELTKKHKNQGVSNESANLAKSGTESPGEGFDLYLWEKCFEICKKTHGESLPCLTMADFNAFLTSHTQNFIAKGCGALDLYNDIFGKQDLKSLLKKEIGRESKIVKNEIANSESSTLVSLDLGMFLDDPFILKAGHSVAQFLEKDFPNPLNPVFCVTFRKREAFNAIKYYSNDVDYACLIIPSFLSKVKSTMNCIEDLKAQIYTEGSYLVMQDIKDEVFKAVKDSTSVLRNVNQIKHTIESGNELVETLSAWANYECTLAEAKTSLQKRHECFLETSPFDKVEKLKDLCEHLTKSSRAISRTVEELEGMQSDALTFSPSSIPGNITDGLKNTRERPPTINFPRNTSPDEVSTSSTSGSSD